MTDSASLANKTTGLTSPLIAKLETFGSPLIDLAIRV